MNKISKGFLGLLLAAVGASVCANTLTINFTGMEKPEGKIMAAIYDSEKAYSGAAKPAYIGEHPVDGTTGKLVFENMSDGTYAIKSFLDTNGNGSLDTNIVGLPTEQYGFSNNVGRFGPPSFDEATFSVNGDTEIAIRLR